MVTIVERPRLRGEINRLSRVAHWIERHPAIHGLALHVWKLCPPRIVGFLKGQFARNWIVGAVAVMVDEEASPPRVLLVEHSYRPRGAWGLPGGSLESIPGNPHAPGAEASPDDILEATLRREVAEELGIGIEKIELLRLDAVPYIPEEPGPYRLDFYFRCQPEGGFSALKRRLASGEFTASSPEIRNVQLVSLTELGRYDLFSADARFLEKDLPRLVPELGLSPAGNLNG